MEKIFVPKTVWSARYSENGKELWTVNRNPNLVTREGCIYTINTNFYGLTPLSGWYIFLFGNDVVPDFEDFYDEMFLKYTEVLGLSNSQRPAWNKPSSPELILTNTDNPAVFAFTEAATIYGAGLISTSDLGTIVGEGILYAVARFAEPHNVDIGGDLEVWCSLETGIPS
jgi:hypothetical protein